MLPPTTSRFLVRHSAGRTSFSHASHGLRHELDVFVDPSDPVKLSRLTPREHERAPAPAERLRLQRVDPRAAPRGPGDPRRNRARRGERRDPRPQPLQHRVSGARGLRARERELPLGHGRPRVVPGPQRVAGEARRPAARGSVRTVRRRARSLRRPARARRPRARRDANARLPARPGAERRGRARDPVPSLLARGGRGRAPREPPVVGPHARRRAGAHTGRLLRPADEPVAPLPGAQLPHVGAVGLLPAGRRVRIPRPAPGRHGARPRPPGPHPRAPAARRAPPVHGGRRPALVARAGRPGHAHPLLGRHAVAAVRRRALRSHDRGHGRPRRGRRRSSRRPRSRRRQPRPTSSRGSAPRPARSSSTARARSRGASPPARTACPSSAAATGTTG